MKAGSLCVSVRLFFLRASPVPAATFSSPVTLLAITKRRRSNGVAMEVWKAGLSFLLLTACTDMKNVEIHMLVLRYVPGRATA